MKFEFGKYTEITRLYKKYSPNLKENDEYIRFFICLDVWDYWIIRIIKGYNEKYEKEEGTFLLEREKIAKEDRADDLDIRKVIKIIKNDDFSNWDIKEYFDIEDIIYDIDEGLGINNLQNG